MNSQYENRPKKNSMLADLVSANTERVEEISLTPYQPVVYAIPQKQREAEYQLLQKAAEFQPELYRRIGMLATREALEEHVHRIMDIEAQYMEKSVTELKTANSKTISRMEQSIEQAGKNQERFISDGYSRLSAYTRELNSAINGLRDKILRIQLLTAAAAVTLSVIVSVVLWRLLR